VASSAVAAPSVAFSAFERSAAFRALVPPKAPFRAVPAPRLAFSGLELVSVAFKGGQGSVVLILPPPPAHSGGAIASLPVPA